MFEPDMFDIYINAVQAGARVSHASGRLHKNCQPSKNMTMWSLGGAL
jgi:hypothetical protein